tara:strand:- start:399 stop:581 length:183 start_codon:yes stop_codon:yes gene_type:complete
MKLENGDSVIIRIKEDRMRLMWHVTVEREKDGRVAWTTCGEEPNEKSDVVQDLCRLLMVK